MDRAFQRPGERDLARLDELGGQLVAGEGEDVTGEQPPTGSQGEGAPVAPVEVVGHRPLPWPAPQTGRGEKPPGHATARASGRAGLCPSRRRWSKCGRRDSPLTLRVATVRGEEGAERALEWGMVARGLRMKFVALFVAKNFPRRPSSSDEGLLGMGVGLGEGLLRSAIRDYAVCVGANRRLPISEPIAEATWRGPAGPSPSLGRTNL